MARTFKATPYSYMRHQKHANVKRVLGFNDPELKAFGIKAQPHKTVDPYTLDKQPQGYKKANMINIKKKGNKV